MRVIALEDIAVSIKPEEKDPNTPGFISVWYEVSIDHKLKRRRERFILFSVPFDITIQEAYDLALAEIHKREKFPEKENG